MTSLLCTQMNSRVGFLRRQSPRVRSIANGSILLILIRLRSSNRGSFRASRKPTLEFIWVYLFVSLFLMSSLFGKESQDDFDALMGKSTEHWNYICQAQDLEELAFVKALYQKNKAAQFTDQGPYKIPPVIHFIWLGPRPFPPESVENVRSWIALNPGWKVKFWTDREREPPCEGMEMVLVKDFPFLKLGKCFEQSQNWGEKSDLLRYEILFREGGVYADHDANCLQSFNGLHRGYDLYCCLEAPHEAFVGRNITCGNGLIGARAGHPTLIKVIDLIATRWDRLAEKFRGRDAHSLIEIVMQRTYIALTDAFRETMCQGENVDIVFPSAYFFAKSGIPSLYSKHFYSSAWDEFKKPKETRTFKQTLGKIQQKNNNLSYLAIGLIGLNALLFGITIFKR